MLRPDMFEYHLNLHCSQTRAYVFIGLYTFEYHLNLHCSQTGKGRTQKGQVFEYHLNLHCSQTSNLKICTQQTDLPVRAAALPSNGNP